MPLPRPDLNNHSFDQLVADAVALIKTKGNAWREVAVGDPGLVLLDAFAYIAEQLLSSQPYSREGVRRVS